MSTGISVDLNSDLGEGFGPWSMGDDRGHARHRLLRQSGLRLPCRRSRHHDGYRQGGAREGRRHRCPSRLPRSLGLRPPPDHRRQPGRYREDGGVPDRRPARRRRLVRPSRQPRQAAWRALQHGGGRPGACRRHRQCHPRRRSPPALRRPAGQRDGTRRPRRRLGRRLRGLRRPGLSRRRQSGAARPARRPDPRSRRGGPPHGGDGDDRQGPGACPARWSRSRPTRSASTATAPPPSRWQGRCEAP